MQLKKNYQQGFTLIELMIVIAIIGILAAVAVPQYQDYTIRTQVVEGLAMVAEVKASISDFYAARGRFPDDNVSAGLAAADSLTGNYVQSIEIVETGQIDIEYGNRANANITDGILTIRAGRNDAGNIVWLCGNQEAPTGVTVAATNDTDISGRYLPVDCRQ